MSHKKWIVVVMISIVAFVVTSVVMPSKKQKLLVDVDVAVVDLPKDAGIDCSVLCPTEPPDAGASDAGQLDGGL